LQIKKHVSSARVSGRPWRASGERDREYTVSAAALRADLKQHGITTEEAEPATDPKQQQAAR